MRGFKALLVVFALSSAGPALALSGHITNLSGAVIAKGGDGRSRILSIKSEVNEGDLLATSENSYARIKFTDGTEVVLRPATQMKIEAYKYEEKTPESDNIVMSLLKGGMRSVTGLLGKRNPKNFHLATPNATIGIRGTNFGAMFCANDCGSVKMPGGGAAPNGLHVDVADGAISVTTQAGTADFKVGQNGFVASASTPPVLVPPSQGVRVTLPAAALGGPTASGVGKSNATECKF